MDYDIKLKLTQIQDHENINELLSDEQSRAIGYSVKQTFEADKASRLRWETKMQDATDLALQLVETKSYPWPNSANVKFPLVTIAAMQFAARAYPALVKAPDLVKFRVQGKDDGTKAARAERISSHMSYQLLEEDEGWEEDHDKALLALPILGCVFKKSYYDKNSGHNKSPLVLPKNLVVHYYAKSIEDCERKTEILQLSTRQIKERQLRGIFSDIEFHGNAVPEASATDKREGITPPFDERDRPRTLLEQHCYYDLDGDGYKEPYVVTIDKDTSQVLRIVNRFASIETEQSIKIEEIQKRMKALAEGLDPNEGDPAVARAAEATIMKMQQEIEMLAAQKPKILKINAVEHYTKYTFIPSPDGGFYDLGFGALLGPLNDSVNTLLNQLIDSGSMQSGSVGFIGKGARIQGGKVRFSPNEWKKVNVAGATLRDNIVPLPVNQPSQVLFNLLSLLISYSERVGSITDAMTGQNPGQNTPAYNMSAMLEQGLQVFNGVFKRVYRSMRSEFRKLYNLNAIYLDEKVYLEYQDSSGEVGKTDYTADPKDLIPAADPNAFSNKEKIQKAQMIAERAAMVPGYDPISVERRILEAMDIPDAAEVFPLQQNPETGRMEYVFPPQPDPELEIKKADMQRRTLEGQSRAEKDAIMAEASVMKTEAEVALIYAKAQTEESNLELGPLKLLLEEFKDKRKAITDLVKMEVEREKISAAKDKPKSSS
jgi:chaperonin GroES